MNHISRDKALELLTKYNKVLLSYSACFYRRSSYEVVCE